MEVGNFVGQMGLPASKKLVMRQALLPRRHTRTDRLLHVEVQYGTSYVVQWIFNEFVKWGC